MLEKQINVNVVYYIRVQVLHTLGDSIHILDVYITVSIIWLDWLPGLDTQEPSLLPGTV